MSLKFNCKTINKGNKCKYLQEKSSQKLIVPKFYICEILNSVLLPDVADRGKLTENINGLSPLFHCPVMKEKRLKKKAKDVVFTIYPDKSTEYWNEEK